MLIIEHTTLVGCTPRTFREMRGDMLLLSRSQFAIAMSDEHVLVETIIVMLRLLKLVHGTSCEIHVQRELVMHQQKLWQRLLPVQSPRNSNQYYATINRFVAALAFLLKWRGRKRPVHRQGYVVPGPGVLHPRMRYAEPVLQHVPRDCCGVDVYARH